METVAAVEIFSRSIEKRKLKYTAFVGDGDSSSFGRVKAALDEKFGPDYEIKKEECGPCPEMTWDCFEEIQER